MNKFEQELAFDGLKPVAGYTPSPVYRPSGPLVVDAERFAFAHHLTTRVPGTRLTAAGLYVLIGKTNSNKSPIAAALAGVASRAVPTSLIAYGEPVFNGIIPALVEAELIKHTSEEVLDSSFLVIDSLRLVQYEIAGAAASGGLSVKFFEYLTVLDVVASVTGRVIVAIVNPNAEDDDKFAQIRATLEGSVTGVIELDRMSSLGTFRSRFSGRQSTPLREFIPSVLKQAVGQSQPLPPTTITVGSPIVTPAAQVLPATAPGSPLPHTVRDVTKSPFHIDINDAKVLI